VTSLFLEDFRLGLDVRKNILTAQPGSLQTLDNAVITDGGEIERRGAFVQVATLPAGATKGLYGTNAGTNGGAELWVFGIGGAAGTSSTNSTITMSTGDAVPVNISYLASDGGGSALAEITNIEQYGPDQFFVCGYETAAGATTLRNWWLGNYVTTYVGDAPLMAGQKMYRLSGSTMYFSGVGDPSVTDPLAPDGVDPNTVNPGAGFIDMSHVDSDADYLTAMGPYYKQVAIFSRRCCLLFELDPDLANNTFEQVLRIGCAFHQTVVQFGTGDLLFLSDTGLRSLRVINASLAAGVVDVGSPIDNILRPLVASGAVTHTDSQPPYAQAVIDPLTGRYFLAIANVIYVLSYWPSAKISAWSTFTLPYNVDHIATCGSYVFVRSGDTVYKYLGLDGATYGTDYVTTVRTPHMAADSPTIVKTVESVNAMVVGDWAVSVGMATENPAFYELCVNLTTNTYSSQAIPFAGEGTHIGFLATCSDPGPSILGALAIKFEKTVET
jgi:hypothetical protein